MLNLHELLFIFGIGSILGWILELFWRPIFVSHKLVNPGLFFGPYLPIYGFGTIIAYLIFSLTLPLWKTVLIFTILVTVLELITGILLSYYKIVLWDYSNYFMNYRGYISILQSVVWALSGIAFYYTLFPRLNTWLTFLPSSNISFILGITYGIFVIDAIYTLKLVNKVRKYMSNVRWMHLPRIKINFVELKENLTENIAKIKKQNILSKFTFTDEKAEQRSLFEQIDRLVKRKMK
ncbi:MAG: putative ABC transporter permease [Candidatus Woesearchaeota archaeon]|jgi:uncharacterized membrane protein